MGQEAAALSSPKQLTPWLLSRVLLLRGWDQREPPGALGGLQPFEPSSSVLPPGQAQAQAGTPSPDTTLGSPVCL